MDIIFKTSAYVVMNDNVSTSLGKEISAWLKARNISCSTSYEKTNLYMGADMPQHKHLFFIFDNNSNDKLSARVVKHIKYAKAIKMPVFMIYKRHSDDSIEIYNFNTYNDNTLAFGSNCTEWVLSTYEHITHAWQTKGFKPLKVLQEFLKIEDKMPQIKNKSYVEMIANVNKRIEIFKTEEKKSIFAKVNELVAIKNIDRNFNLEHPVLPKDAYVEILKPLLVVRRTKRTKRDNKNIGKVFITGTGGECKDYVDFYQKAWLGTFAPSEFNLDGLSSFDIGGLKKQLKKVNRRRNLLKRVKR